LTWGVGSLNFSVFSLLLSDIARILQIVFSLKDTLRDLKVAISQSTALGKIPVDCQRIFHLGRELKTPGRTLEALGVGRFQGLNKTVIHVHATPSGSVTNPSTVTTINTVDVAQPSQRRRVAQPARKSLSVHSRHTRSTGVPEVVNLESDDDDVVAIDVDSTPNHQTKRRRQI
jgi:hypothetical protein